MLTAPHFTPVNPSLAPACEISRQKSAPTHPLTEYFLVLSKTGDCLNSENNIHKINTTDDDEVELRVLGCWSTYYGQTVTNAEAWFSVTLHPQKL